MITMRRNVRLLILSVVLLLLAACGGGGTGTEDPGGETTAGSTAGGSEPAQGDAPAEPVGSMVLGVGIDAAYASVLVAVEQGFMERHGVAAEIRQFSSGQESLEAVLTGQADFTGNGQYNIPIVAARGGDIRIIAEYETSDEQFGAVAVEGIDGPEDLVGKTVATQFGTSPDYYFRLYAEEYGLDVSQVNFVNLQFAQMVPAMTNGEIDAFFAFEPHLQNALESVSGSQVLHRSGDDGVMPLRVFAGVSPRVYEDPELATAFLQALSEAGEWTNENPEEAAQLLSDTFEIELEDAQRYVGYFDYTVGFDQEALDELDRVAQFVVDQEIVDTAPELDQFVDTSFIERIASDGG